jgi:hypothetical protein
MRRSGSSVAAARRQSGAREQVVSSFTLVKGTLLLETYSAFAHWNLELPKRDNLQQLREKNTIGAGSETWLRDVAKVLNRRFETEARDRALVELAQARCPLDLWTPLLLWHITRDEFLLRDFLCEWLFPAFVSGAYRILPEELHGYLHSLPQRGGQTEHHWTEATVRRVSAGLLKAATDFGLLEGTRARRFASYHLPEKSFLYLLHALAEVHLNPSRIIQSPDWRMYLLRPEDVEREILRLHQFRLLEYHVAGSIAQLTLPCATAREYAQRFLA